VSLHVWFLLDSASGRDLSGCKCPPRCKNVVHEATISSSQLSDTMMEYYRSYENDDTEIGGRYVNAAETRNRVGTSLLTEVISHLEKLVRDYQRLKAILAVDLIEHTTSVPGQILASINTIVRQTQYSLNKFRSEIFDKFVEYYERKMDFMVSHVVSSAKYTLGNHRRFLTDEIINDICKEFDVPTDLDCNSDNDSFLAKLSIDRTCDHLINNYTNYCTQNKSERNDSSIMREFQKLASDTLKCVPQYRTFLDEVQQWLTLTVTMNANLPLKPTDRRHVLAELEHELNWMNATSSTFSKKTVVGSFEFYDKKIVSIFKRFYAS